MRAAFDAGATDYIKKPFEEVELLARVKATLKLKKEIDARKNWEQEPTKAPRPQLRSREFQKASAGQNQKGSLLEAWEGGAPADFSYPSGRISTSSNLIFRWR